MAKFRPIWCQHSNKKATLSIAALDIVVLSVFMLEV
jgi:hypothetical protein